MVPIQTRLRLFRPVDPQTILSSTVVGTNRWGISVSLPELRGQAVPMPAGTRLICQFWNENRMVQFQTQVVGYEQTQPPRMVIREPEELEEVNRRDTLRLQVELPVSFTLDHDQLTFEKTKTVDLSLGGLRMVTAHVIPWGRTIQLSLELPDGPLQLEGWTRWSGYAGKIKMTGVEFAPLRVQTHQTLYRYIVWLEREQARLGILPVRPSSS